MTPSERVRVYELLRAQCKRERQSWESHWQELANFLRPRAIRLDTSQTNDGRKKYTNNNIDNTGILAARTLSAGLMAGVSSPSSPWFRLMMDSGQDIEPGPVREWLDLVEIVMRAVFARSNTYNTLHTLYDDLGIFGVAAAFVERDFDTVIHHTPFVMGEYALSTDHRRRVNGVVREFKMSVAQMAQQFGVDKLVGAAKTAFETQQYMQMFDVVHVMKPRQDFKTGIVATDMPYESVYYQTAEGGHILRESGYRTLRLLAPRWVVRGNDIYGESPGMDALGDVKQLQHQQLSKGRAIDYKIDPPLVAPTRYKGAGIARFPGGITYVDGAGQEDVIRSAYQVDLDLVALREDILDVRERVNKAFFRDLFLMISSDTRSNITAYEIAERNTEKLLMLGPILERVHDELLGPLIDLTFDAIMEANILPPPPREIQGRDLKVEFTSILAQAQKATGARSLDRLIESVARMAQLNPETVDKLNFDQTVDEYASMFAVRQSVVRPDDEVAEIRAQRAQQAMAEQQSASVAGFADAAKKFAETDPAKAKETLAAFMGGGGAGGA